MKNILKEIIEKTPKILKMGVCVFTKGICTALEVAVTIALYVIGGAFVVVSPIIIITIGLPVMLIKATTEYISLNVEYRKKKKELLKKYQEKNNFQLNYAVERSNNIQEVKQDDEKIYIESLVPVSEEELDMIKETVPQCDKQDIAKIKAYEAKQKEILTETNTSRLQILKQELMRLSFELQDIATSHNLFIKNCETPQEIYDNREELQKAKTLTIK